MKIPIVYWLSSAAVAVIGATVMVAGYLQMERQNNGVSETFTESGITSIHTELPRCALKVVSSETAEEATIELKNAPSTVKVYTKDGTLFVTDAGWSNFHFISFGEVAGQVGEIVITVPPEHYESVILSTGFGEENAVSGIRADRLKMDTGAGNWSISDVQCGAFSIDTGAGTTDMRSCTFGTLAYSSGAGNLTGSGVTVQERADFDCGAGNCTLDVWTFEGKTEFDCGMGNLELNDLRLTADMDIDLGAGNLKMGIIGEPGDYTVDCSDHVGNTSISGNSATVWKGGDYRITVDGVGNVDIDFHE